MSMYAGSRWLCPLRPRWLCQVSVISGGITNLLWKLTPQGSPEGASGSTHGGVHGEASRSSYEGAHGEASRSSQGGSPNAAQLPPVLLRVFGQDTDKLIDRQTEAANLLHLNRCGFGAKVASSVCA